MLVTGEALVYVMKGFRMPMPDQPCQVLLYLGRSIARPIPLRIYTVSTRDFRIAVSYVQHCFEILGNGFKDMLLTVDYKYLHLRCRLVETNNIHCA